MTAEVYGLTIVASIIIAAILACVTVLVRRFVRALWTEKRRIRCPLTDEDFDVVFQRHLFGDRLIDVERCSFFPHPKNVVCDKECLHGLGTVSIPHAKESKT
jgi:hypothetical protein